MARFLMPKLGADMTRARSSNGARSPATGSSAATSIAVVETDKVNVDVESFVTGVLETILVEPRDEGCRSARRSR